MPHPGWESLWGSRVFGSEGSPSQCVSSLASLQAMRDGNCSWRDWPRGFWEPQESLLQIIPFFRPKYSISIFKKLSLNTILQTILCTNIGESCNLGSVWWIFINLFRNNLKLSKTWLVVKPFCTDNAITSYRDEGWLLYIISFNLTRAIPLICHLKISIFYLLQRISFLSEVTAKLITCQF